MVSEMVKGKSIDEALEISSRAVAEALKLAIEDYLGKSQKRSADGEGERVP